MHVYLCGFLPYTQGPSVCLGRCVYGKNTQGPSACRLSCPVCQARHAETEDFPACTYSAGRTVRACTVLPARTGVSHNPAQSCLHPQSCLCAHNVLPAHTHSRASTHTQSCQHTHTVLPAHTVCCIMPLHRDGSAATLIILTHRAGGST